MTVSKPCEPGGYAVERRGDDAVARALQGLDTCTGCGGTGLTLTEVNENGRTYTVSTPCERAKLLQRVNIFNQAHVPAVHATSTFANFNGARSEQNQAKELAQRFSFAWPKSRGFILSGPVGSGKTHLLSAVLRHLTLELGVRSGYVEISLLYATIRRGFQLGKSGGEIIGPLSQVEVLAIDELGKGRGSAFELETLDELIARRYNANKVTLFATNYSLKPLEAKQHPDGYITTAASLEAGKESKLLAERVSDRIFSRLYDMCDFVEFPLNTPDMRRSRHLHSGVR